MAERIDWYRTPVDREFLKQLTVRSDVTGLLQSVSFLLIYAFTVFLACYFFARRLRIPMLAVCSIHFMFHGFTGTEAAVHELSHGTPFKSRWLNELFYRLFCFLSWSNWVHFRASHMLHLRFTGTAPRVPGRYSEDHVYPEAAAARSRLLLRPGVSANRCCAQIFVLNLPTVILHACLTLCGR